MTTPSIHFTQEGYDTLIHEKNELDLRRKSAVSELSTARDMGDRSENAFYKTARQKLSSIDRRLREIARILRFAKIVEPSKSGVAELGSVVTLEGINGTVTYKIVGKFESDLTKSWISIVSPLGNALLGKKIGEAVQLQMPQGTTSYKILQIA